MKTRLILLAIVVAGILAVRPALQARQTAARHGGPAAENGLAMEFVKISPGQFMMGCSAGDDQCYDDEKPSHRVQITNGFEIGKYEVTEG
jgi:formylglycine-generating enzyme required for sulfatase activity